MLQSKLKMKDIDLLTAYKKKKEPSKYTSIIKIVAVPAIGAILLLTIYGFLSYQNYALDKKIANTKSEISAVKKQIANDPDLSKANTLASIQAKTEKYKTLYSNMQSYPQLSMNTFDQLLIASGLQVDITAFSYTRESQIITLQIEAADANDAEQFVRRIKATDTFASVQYSGYSQVSKTIKSNTATSGSDTSSSDEKTDLQQLVDALNNNKTKEETASETVYTATILCMLK